MNYIIRGKITDADTGEPIPYANIVLYGGADYIDPGRILNQVQSDVNGFYFLDDNTSLFRMESTIPNKIGADFWLKITHISYAQKVQSVTANFPGFKTDQPIENFENPDFQPGKANNIELSPVTYRLPEVIIEAPKGKRKFPWWIIILLLAAFKK